MKDPAFLFYFRDFLVSTELMSAEDVGYYIRILCHMADKGRLNINHMQSICKAYSKAHILHEKFKVDENGFYYNQKLDEELEKRRNYTQSRRDNAKHMHKHMGNANGNGNEDIIVNKDVIKEKRRTFKKPNLDEVKNYCLERRNNIDPEIFFHNYESVGWVKANGQPVLNWKSTLITWEKRQIGDKNDKHKRNNESNDEQIERRKKLNELGEKV